MPTSNWPRSGSSERSSRHCVRRDSIISKAGSDTFASLIQNQACLRTPTTSEFGSHTGYHDSHDNHDSHDSPDPASFTSRPTSLPIRSPKWAGPKERRIRNVCNSALVIEPRKPRELARSYVQLPKRAHSPDDRRPTTADESLDTSETSRRAVPKLDPGHQFGAVKDEIVRIAVKKFSSLCEHTPRAKSMDSYLRQCPKQLRLHPSENLATLALFSDSEASDGILMGQNPVGTEPNIWPCPFFVNDRESNIDCLRRHCLLSMADVREHLILMHRRPIYCSICSKTFSTVNFRDVHMRAGICDRKASVIPEGITDAQVQALHEQGSREESFSGSQLGQWFQIWQIVFPRAQAFPWLCSFRSAELKVYELRRFWRRNGEDIISDVLRRYGLQEYSIENEERNLQALFSLVADHAVDDLLLIETTQTQAA